MSDTGHNNDIAPARPSGEHLVYYLRNGIEDSRMAEAIAIRAALLIVPGVPLLWWLVNPLLAVLVGVRAVAFFPRRHVFFRRSPRPLAVLHTPKGEEFPAEGTCGEATYIPIADLSAWRQHGDLAWTTPAPHDDEASTEPPGTAAEHLPDGTEITVTGYGRRGGDGTLGCNLQHIPAHVAAPVECEHLRTNRTLQQETLCIRGPAICGGFSGSLVRAGARPMAVVSSGDSCSNPAGRTLAISLSTIRNIQQTIGAPVEPGS